MFFKLVLRFHLATRQFEKQDADKTAADYTNHDAPDPNLGSEGVIAAVTMFKQAFPDAQHKIAFQLTEGDKVASCYTWSGTHQGEYYGIRATGKRVKWTSTATFRIVDGKIHETWLNYDRLGMMQQLGVVEGISATLQQAGQ